MDESTRIRHIGKIRQRFLNARTAASARSAVQAMVDNPDISWKDLLDQLYLFHQHKPVRITTIQLDALSERESDLFESIAELLIDDNEVACDR